MCVRCLRKLQAKQIKNKPLKRLPERKEPRDPADDCETQLRYVCLRCLCYRCGSLIWRSCFALDQPHFYCILLKERIEQLQADNSKLRAEIGQLRADGGLEIASGAPDDLQLQLERIYHDRDVLEGLPLLVDGSRDSFASDQEDTQAGAGGPGHVDDRPLGRRQSLSAVNVRGFYLPSHVRESLCIPLHWLLLS